MRIADLDPMTGKDWNAGDYMPQAVDREFKCGHWTAHDYCVGPGHIRFRDVYHYGTMMVRYAYTDHWFVNRVTIGHGTVSDQGGVNALVGHYGFRMLRDAAGGGPRVVNVATGEVEAD